MRTRPWGLPATPLADVLVLEGGRVIVAHQQQGEGVDVEEEPVRMGFADERPAGERAVPGAVLDVEEHRQVGVLGLVPLGRREVAEVPLDLPLSKVL
jgi:hypothetical protein